MLKAPQWVLMRLKWFASEWDFRVTAGSGGKHNTGSLHALNRAIDVSVRGKSNLEVTAFMNRANAYGYVVSDERTRPAGQAVWSGPHLHVEDRGDFDLNNDGQ
jgi:hypothetical protein